MADIKLFNINEKVTELQSGNVTLEKELQTVIENNMETFFGVTFLASEYKTTDGGRMDSIGIDENHCPVIFEYKRSMKENVINQGTLGIGFIGLAEALIALTGMHHGESEYSQELGLKIISHMRDKANEYSELYKHNYSILATPAEGLSGKFTKNDKEKYGVIEGITDKEYYTNSNHVPVYYKCTPSHNSWYY